MHFFPTLSVLQTLLFFCVLWHVPAQLRAGAIALFGCQLRSSRALSATLHLEDAVHQFGGALLRSEDGAILLNLQVGLAGSDVDHFLGLVAVAVFGHNGQDEGLFDRHIGSGRSAE